MNITSPNQLKQTRTRSVRAFSLISLTLLCGSLFVNSAQAQTASDIKWKGQAQIKRMYGEPRTVRGPIGTHASYAIWEYADFSIAFANNKAFHLFRNDSLKKVVLQQQRVN